MECEGTAVSSIATSCQQGGVSREKWGRKANRPREGEGQSEEGERPGHYWYARGAFSLPFLVGWMVGSGKAKAAWGLGGALFEAPRPGL